MLTYDLAPKGALPLYQQLYLAIREDIERERLPAGEKLPSRRQLAAHLHLSTVTVDGAYAQLVAEGYLIPEPKRGYFVQRLERLPAPSAPPPVPPAEREEDPPPFDFKTSSVDTGRFPYATWARLTREVLSEGGDQLLRATPPQGLYALRLEIARSLRAFRGISVTPEQIVVGSGSEYLMGLIVQLLGRELGYAVEDPGYHKILRVFEGSGAPTAPLPLDSHGLRLDALEASGAQVVHVTPSHHFPLGIVMPVSRRQALLKWAAQDGRYLIEDDYDSEFRFSGRPIPALMGMDAGGRVIYLNTFAKSLAPSLRIGYLVLPPGLARRYQEKLSFYACTVPSFEQHTLALFLGRGHFERHISRMRVLYKARRDALLAALRRSPLGRLCRVSGQQAGLNLLLQVDNGMSEAELVASAAKLGVGVYGLSGYYAAQSPACPPATVVLGYSALTEEQIAQAAALLALAWTC